MKVLDDYLYGYSRHPFHKTNGNYILLLTKDVEQDWRVKIEAVMERMWKDYAVLNLLIISICELDLEAQEIGFYDPFQQNEGNSTWGILRWIKFHDLIQRQNWFLNKSKNFRGFPLKFSKFERYPSFLSKSQLPKIHVDSYVGAVMNYTYGYGGFDGLVLGNLAKYLNFKVILLDAPDATQYGYVQPNGSYTGTLKDVLFHRADVAINSRFVTEINVTEVEFMYPIYCDQFCVICPKALKVPQSLAIFLSFNPIVWVAFILVNFLCGYTWYLFKKWALQKKRMGVLRIKSHEKYSPEYDRCSVLSVEIWLIMLSGPSPKMPFRTAERLFMSACLLANVIIAGTFQGTLTTSFSTSSYYSDISTLADLDESGLHVGTTSRSLGNIFGDDDDNGSPLMQSLSRKFDVLKLPAIVRTAYRRDVCGVERAADINLIMTTKYELNDGSPLLHLVPECPRTYYLAYIVKRGWPFLSTFSMAIRRFSEAGLMEKWIKEPEDAIILNHRITSIAEETGSKPFSLIDMQTSFYILGMGHIICTVVFLIEILVEQRIGKVGLWSRRR